jgi:dihydroorotate dehydrogenase electron transfer subunit
MRVAGEGTQDIASGHEFLKFKAVGPLGNGFSDCDENEVLLVGGGLGTPPLLFLAQRLSALHPKMKIKAALGYKSSDDIIVKKAITEACGKGYVFTATDDGKTGFHGNVIQLLREKKGFNPGRIYACGPRPMLKALAEYAAERNIPCEVSMEEHMGCGIGACLCCPVSMKDGTLKRVCRDGPVFDSAEIAWDEVSGS